MKTHTFLFVLALLPLFFSCSTYQQYVQVTPQSVVPENTLSILIQTPSDSLKQIFFRNQILISSKEGGFETEEILLDAGTRAMYKVYEFDGQTQITAYWGITQAVKSQMAIWAGSAAAQNYETDEWYRVSYNNKATRPKKVFDYALQLLEQNDIKYTLK